MTTTKQQQMPIDPELGKLTTIGVSKFTKIAMAEFQQGCLLKGYNIGRANADELIDELITYYINREFTDDEKTEYDNALHYATGCKIATWSDLNDVSSITRKTRQDCLNASKEAKAEIKALNEATKSSTTTKKKTK